MAGYTKLFSDIIHSTVWREDVHTKIVWITMLAMSDRHGQVMSSLPGLADSAKVALEQCIEALRILSSPDQYSRTKEYEGRRISEIDGGWLILTYEKHRARKDDEEQRLRTAERVRQYRARLLVTDIVTVRTSNPIAEAEAEAETKVVKILASSAKIALSANGLWENIPEEMMSAWKRAHPAINLNTELAKAAAWIMANPKNIKKNYAKFITNWLSRSQDRAPRAQTRESAVDRVRRANAD